MARKKASSFKVDEVEIGRVQNVVTGETLDVTRNIGLGKTETVPIRIRQNTYRLIHMIVGVTGESIQDFIDRLVLKEGSSSVEGLPRIMARLIDGMQKAKAEAAANEARP